MRFLAAKTRKPKDYLPKILFFEMFAPDISKNILENLKILRMNNLHLKPVSAKLRKPKNPPK